MNGYAIGTSQKVWNQWKDKLLIGNMGALPVLSFSRGQEEEADEDARRGILAHYGHVESSVAFFEHIAKEEATLAPLAIFSTHPELEDRLKRTNSSAERIPVNRPRRPA